jgi:hypothetical protein
MKLPLCYYFFFFFFFFCQRLPIWFGGKGGLLSSFCQSGLVEKEGF